MSYFEIQNQESLLHQQYDFIIVGTGMGGGPIGLKLAQAGFSVLFVEQGQSQNSENALKGLFAEEYMLEDSFQRSGRFSEEFIDASSSKKIKKFPMMGTGVGGSSALYGMILERFNENDFNNWPMTFASMQPYYQAAEELFACQVSTSLKSSKNKKIMNYLISQNLNPYYLKKANEGGIQCQECQSVLCAKGCKNDSEKICVRPAVEKYGAKLLTKARVTSLIIEGNKAQGVRLEYKGGHHELYCKTVILAAGALNSPIILQNSQLEKSLPLIGRNLMRHYVDLFLLKMNQPDTHHGAKEIGVNDFYSRGVTLQNFGKMPPPKVMERSLPMGKVIAPLIYGFIKNRLVFASIMEDQGHRDNRVWSEDGTIYISYRISHEDQEKIKDVRKTVMSLFRPFSPLLVKSAEKNEMLAHVCGTCKMGQSPDDSVLDVFNRVHGYENLLVVDASFFPSSGATNPALTIAANSLRIADFLVSQSNTKK